LPHVNGERLMNSLAGQRSFQTNGNSRTLITRGRGNSAELRGDFRPTSFGDLSVVRAEA
jgi:hypothetical protein